jgi:hypothetical protein
VTFEPGNALGVRYGPANTASVKHGCYSRLLLSSRAEEIGQTVRELLPIGAPADDFTVDAFSFVLAQIERASIVLATHQAAELQRLQDGGTLTAGERDDLRRLSADARGWANVALRYSDALGLTPTSRARLGLDIAATKRQLSVIEYYGRREQEGEAA